MNHFVNCRNIIGNDIKHVFMIDGEILFTLKQENVIFHETVPLDAEHMYRYMSQCFG